ncbi:hypothetical protein NQZ68_002073 [Dissostichus eleginoides]|uniref:Ras-GEF domain containing family member 1A n=1 Tax=Dissostichus eleginoides TaxID=100907 RepID=A0AAD9BB53_DISEL|nr:hypothetical protein NQZ68_002073 [Dissostichus eleginoides]KAK1880421.1 Ras-GEF domain containing family member 1A [Dissostichus eleginoides]
MGSIWKKLRQVTEDKMFFHSTHTNCLPNGGVINFSENIPVARGAGMLNTCRAQIYCLERVAVNAAGAAPGVSSLFDKVYHNFVCEEHNM